MTLDLTGGMDPTDDHFFAEVPDDPEMRESASFWVFDAEGRIGLPRVGIEAEAKSWDTRGTQVNVTFPDGRVVYVRGLGDGRSPVDDDGVCRTFGSGGLEFRCLEPFARLGLHYGGDAVDTTADVLAHDLLPEGKSVSLSIDVELVPVVPPWISGTLRAEAKELFDEGFAGSFISPRYEQLCEAKGSVAIDDEKWEFYGTGLRIHRQGPRDVDGFWGHCWPSALFPSGRGFGALTFPERDGVPTFNEGFVFDGERMRPARLVDAPWLRNRQAYGEDVSLTLVTDDGEEVGIEAETAMSSFVAPGAVPEFPLCLQQAGVRYRWDGEETIGMMERSIPVEKLES